LLAPGYAIYQGGLMGINSVVGLEWRDKNYDEVTPVLKKTQVPAFQLSVIRAFGTSCVRRY
jgi:hypothetical protein